ncbi:MAG: hypothetical protein HOE90_04365 [Bacteriovoracaceae bacterium]|jgi:hypothetical protein|nr:hypothetical protein [Bacteriovoracaceae bacterium]
MNLRLLAFTILFTLPISSFAEDIVWTPTMVVEDGFYRGGADANSPHDALTWGTWDITSWCHNPSTKKLKIGLKSGIDPDLSWRKIPLDDQLKTHESYHLKLNELWLRKLKKALKESSELEANLLSCNNTGIENAFRDLWDGMWDQYYGESNPCVTASCHYDKETEHGSLPDKQTEWQQNIDQELSDLSDYADEVIELSAPSAGLFQKLLHKLNPIKSAYAESCSDSVKYLFGRLNYSYSHKANLPAPAGSFSWSYSGKWNISVIDKSGEINVSLSNNSYRNDYSGRIIGVSNPGVGPYQNIAGSYEDLGDGEIQYFMDFSSMTSDGASRHILSYDNPYTGDPYKLSFPHVGNLALGQFVRRYGLSISKIKLIQSEEPIRWEIHPNPHATLKLDYKLTSVQCE